MPAEISYTVGSRILEENGTVVPACTVKLTATANLLVPVLLDIPPRVIKTRRPHPNSRNQAVGESYSQKKIDKEMA